MAFDLSDVASFLASLIKRWIDALVSLLAHGRVGEGEIDEVLQSTMGGLILRTNSGLEIICYMCQYRACDGSGLESHRNSMYV